MNTEPPQGDDLQQMLVSMKHNVLARAELDRPVPKRRGRRAGIVIGIIAVLGIGVGSGAVALGMVPQPFTAAPAPSPTVTEPPQTPTKSSAPVVNEPTATPTPTPTRKPFALDDPSTWTISSGEVGPVALGGATAAELDDLDAAYTRITDEFCPNPNVFFYGRGAEQSITITQVDGKVFGITVGRNEAPDEPRGSGPTTAEGLGVGSTLAQLKAAYPGLEHQDSGDAYGLPMWTLDDGGRYITFVLSSDDGLVNVVWISTSPRPPYEYCG